MKSIYLDKYWSSAFDFMDDYVFLLDRNFKVLRVNASFAKFVKRNKRDLIGKKCYRILHKSNKPFKGCPHLELLSTGKFASSEFYEPRLQKWLSMRVTPVFSSKKELAGSIHITADITELKRTEKDLRESEVRYQDLLDNVGVLIQSVRPDGSFLYVNRAWLETLGYDKEELSRMSLFEIIHPDSQAHCKKLFQKVISGEDIGEIEAKFVAKNGRVIDVEGSANCRFEAGKPVATRGIFQDVTEYNRAEAALKESEEKYRTLVDSAQEGIGVVDPEENFLFVNEAFANILGYKTDELVGKNLKELTSKEEFAKYRKETKKRRKGEKNRYETILFHKDGHPRCLSVSAAPLQEKDGSFKGTLGVVMDITDKKGAEEEIEQAREYTDNIISSMVDALIVLDPEGKIQNVNKSLCKLLNYEEKDLISQSFGTLIEEEEEEEEEALALYDKAFKKLLRRGPIIDYMTNFSTKVSEKIPVSISGAVLRNDKEKLIGAVLTARDMRERIASENKIKESEERYRGVVENLTDAIFLLDENGRYVHMNRPGIKLYGWKRLGDILARNFVEDAHRKYFGVLAKAVENACGGKTAECHYESTTNDGLHKWWEVTLVPLKDASGKISNIVGISRDITQRKQSEQIIKFYKEYAEHIVANLPISILILNREIEINFANQHFIKRVGKGRDEVIGKSLEDVLGKAYKGIGFDEKIRAVIKGDDTLPRGRFELRGKHYDYQILRFKERIGRRYNAMLIMEDITERIHLEEQIRDAEKMSAIGQFTAGIAHEINNPLGIVLANIQYLTSNMDKIDFTDKNRVNDLNEVLETIGEQSRRCGEIVSNLLHFTHRGRGEEEDVNVDKVVRRTMQMMEHQLRLSKIECTVDLDGNLPVIRGDVNRLQQVFVNLILNAQHAMANGGRLYIKTFIEDTDWICISFKDMGPGIPKKHQKRIFEPFYTTRKAGEGTGLGLSVVHSIIQEHGGTISVDSKRGVGATFKVTLPCATKKSLFGLWK